MSRLTAGKKSRKKQSEFQTLWAKAEKLKRENVRFRDRLDAIMQRIEAEIRPVEIEAARQQIPLIKRLLTLGQRKSLLKWQRHELDDWIGEVLEPLKCTEHFEEVLDDVCRYDAFRCGIELDETASKPLPDQLREQAGRQDQQAPENDGLFDEDASKTSWQNKVRDEVEKILNRTFGTEPPKPQKPDDHSSDFFQDELFDAEQQRYEEYHKARNAAREELLEEMLAEPTAFSDEEENIFGFGFDPAENISANETPAISNDVFKRLFRAAAGKLHPDRETDPDKRKQKQTLMAQLLTARKDGDVMTIVEFYQQYVDDDSNLSKADEKQLLDSLKLQISALHEAQEDYSRESPLHHMAFESFYHPSAKKTAQAFKHHIQYMKQLALVAISQSQEIRSLKTLKPYLEERYEDRRFDNPFDILDEFFNSMR